MLGRRWIHAKPNLVKDSECVSCQSTDVLIQRAPLRGTDCSLRRLCTSWLTCESIARAVDNALGAGKRTTDPQPPSLSGSRFLSVAATGQYLIQQSSDCSTRANNNKTLLEESPRERASIGCILTPLLPRHSRRHPTGHCYRI